MIHPWVVSRKFLLMQPKMTYWNLFLRRFKSWLMTPSGFSWFDSRINTCGFNQEIPFGSIWWFLNQVLIDLSLDFFEDILNQSSTKTLLILSWVSFGSLWGDLRIESMNQLKTISWNLHKVNCIIILDSCQASWIQSRNQHWTILFKPLQGYL